MEDTLVWHMIAERLPDPAFWPEDFYELESPPRPFDQEPGQVVGPFCTLKMYASRILRFERVELVEQDARGKPLRRYFEWRLVG